jgi:membrane protein DedA with SNARE-associated domain
MICTERCRCPSVRSTALALTVLVSFLEPLLHRFGYAAVALFMVVEGCGIPLPAETMLVTAAAFASRGFLSIWWIGVAGALGGIAGGSAGYGIGAWGGIPVLRRYGPKVGIDKTRLDRAREFFGQHGLWAAFACRFIAFLRIAVPMLAGVTGISFARFTVANVLGAIASAAFYALLGYRFGKDLPALKHHLLLTSIGVLTLLVVAIMVRRARARRRGRAEQNLHKESPRTHP